MSVDVDPRTQGLLVDVDPRAQGLAVEKTPDRSSAGSEGSDASTRRWTRRDFWLGQAVDHTKATLPMACYSFMTGMSDGVSFSGA